MTSRKQPVLVLLAEELHRQYRAAEKALTPPGTAAEFGLRHDHGWEHCQSKDYFHKRATLMVKRAHVDNPETLGEAEQILSATVLLRRLSVEGKLVVPVPVAYQPASERSVSAWDLIPREVTDDAGLTLPSWTASRPLVGRGNGKTRSTIEVILAALEPTDAELKAGRDRKVREAMWGKS